MNPSRRSDANDRAADRDDSGEGDRPRRGTSDPTVVQGAGAASRAVDSSADSAAVMPVHERSAPVREVGPYRLLHEIGNGGMGSVWLAEQTAPVKRRVALKLIKAGLDSKQVIARFEAERQALAMMNHQHIARVFDGGVTEQGEPYFAMELVDGVPLTEFCDRNRLELQSRLRLFIDTCRAVQHAHQKGIIHRDIKPSNILVSMADGKPTPKIIDFGLAKALRHRKPLTDQKIYTEFGQVVGTLTYMSPEQAEMDGLDVDTRTDIYSLGVIFYELLTGSTPLLREMAKQQALLKVLALIRDQETQRPSVRLSNSSDTIEAVAAHRRSKPHDLQQSLSGDLDWIAMKALEKEPARRYDSAAAFADDVQRYLDLEPVIARPPTTGYRLKMFLRKHRRGVTAAAAGIVLLLAGITATTAMYIRATRAQTRAEQNLKLASDAQRRAEAALRSEAAALSQANQTRQLAEDLAERNQKVLDVFVEAFRSVDPANEGVSSETTPLDVLRRAQEKLVGDQMADDPLAKATLLEALGESFLGLGAISDSIAVHRESLALRRARLGAQHPETLQSMHHLASGFRELGDTESALPLFEETHQMRQQVLGFEDRQTLLTASRLAAVYHSLGRLDEALSLYEKTLQSQAKRLGRDHADTLMTMNNLARAYFQKQRFEAALSLNEETLRRRRVTLGADHPDTLTSINNLAASYVDAGRTDQARSLFEELLRRTKAKLGPDHPSTLKSTANLAAFYVNTGHISKAPELLEETLRLTQAKSGADHPDTLRTLINLSASYGLSGNLNKSESLYRDAIKRSKAKFGPHHTFTRVAVRSLQNVLIEMQEFAVAEPVCQEWLEILQASQSGEPGEHVWALVSLADAYEGQGKFDAALQSAEAALQLEQVDAAETERARSILGSCLTADGQWDAGLRESTAAYEALEAQLDHVEFYKRSYVPAAARRVAAIFARKQDVAAQQLWQEKMAAAQRRIEDLRQPDPK